MSSYKKSSYNSHAYTKYRPRYPEALYKELLDYHKSDRKLAIDSGCGNGMATAPLSKYFDQVYGIDPSNIMLVAAKEFNNAENIKFIESNAENLSFIEQESVSLAISATALHWFSIPDYFNEIACKLKPNGTLAYWSYRFSTYPDFPGLDLKSQFLSNSVLGKYWDPKICQLELMYADISPPSKYFVEGKFVDSISIHTEVDIDEFEAGFRTWSSFLEYKLKHPDELSLKQGGEGDIIDQFMSECKQEFGISADSKIHVVTHVPMYLWRRNVVKWEA